MLCDQYHVSRYTVNRVFDALKKDGLIEIQPRLAPVVLDGEKMPGSEHMLRDILKKREGLVQIYRTWTLILPPLLVFATQNCSLEMMPHYKQAMRVSRIGVAAGGWRAFSAFDRDVLKIGGSPLLCDLYSTFELYHDLTFFTEQCPCFYDFFPRGSVPFAGVIMDIMKDTDPVVKHGRLTALYQRLTSSIECTLKHLAETAPDCPPPSEAAFSWRPLRGKDYFYMRIISDLNQKIGSGEYPRRTYLPHEKALAGQYGVSVSTVRKALAELEQRGFVKTLNGKGTVVIEPDSSRVSQVIFSSRRTEEAMRYLQALQLLVLIIHPPGGAGIQQGERGSQDGCQHGGNGSHTNGQCNVALGQIGHHVRGGAAGAGTHKDDADSQLGGQVEQLRQRPCKEGHQGELRNAADDHVFRAAEHHLEVLRLQGKTHAEHDDAQQGVDPCGLYHAEGAGEQQRQCRHHNDDGGHVLAHKVAYFFQCFHDNTPFS